MLTFLFQSLAFAIRPILYYTAFLMSKVNCVLFSVECRGRRYIQDGASAGRC